MVRLSKQRKERSRCPRKHRLPARKAPHQKRNQIQKKVHHTNGVSAVLLAKKIFIPSKMG